MKPCTLFGAKTACHKPKWLTHGLKREDGHRYNADQSWPEKLAGEIAARYPCYVGFGQP